MHIRLDSDSGIPLAVQIQTGLRLQIVAQRLLAGEQLPSARDLAAELKVNLHTVLKAYSQLESEGLLETRRGLGTFVLASQKARVGELRKLVRERLGALVQDLAGSDIDADVLLAMLREELEQLWPGPEPRT